MKKIKIKHRYTGEVIFSHEAENNTVKLTVELAIKLNINLSDANLSHANLSGANLSGANLYSTNLSDANLSGTNLSRVNLYSTNLSDANLSGTNLSRVNLSGANLSRTNLYGTNLYGANLYGANLSRVNLSGANLSRTNLYGTNLYGANLYGANLYHAIGDGRIVKTIALSGWIITFCLKTGVMAIGCKQYKISEWRSFSNNEIKRMDSEAWEWWFKWRDFIFMAIDLSNIEED